MARYQLFRTSPALSGQVRLDILINKDPDSQIISGDDIYIVPLNDNIKFNESNKRNTLKYSHLDNIKNLYREIGSDFYDTSGEYTMESWLYDGGIRQDPYSHIYMTGPKRMRYTRYNKQFSYLAPIWISEYTDISKLRFVCHAGSEDHDVILSSFKLNPDICEYLQEYLDGSANGQGVSDDLLNIDFRNLDSFITGVQASTGQYICKDTSYIMNFLLKQERSMLETDSNILDMFRQNDIIAQQILNLNFVFNMKDIAGAWPEYYLYNKKIRIWIDIQYENNSLEFKDLYTNYTHIPKYDLSIGQYTDKNILDYMEDYNCIDLVSLNKFTQPVFHWSLANNPDYIFNIYSGCAPYIGKDMILEGGSFDWVDISLDTADPWKQNWKWIKSKDYIGVGRYWETEYNDSRNHPKYRFTNIKFHKDYISIGDNIFRNYYNDEDRNIWENSINDVFESPQKIWISNVRSEINSDTDYEFILNHSDDNNHISLVIICPDADNLTLYNICNRRKDYSDDSDNPDVQNIFLHDFINANISTTPDMMDKITKLIRYITGSPMNSDFSKNLWDRWVKPNKIEFNKILKKYCEDKILAGSRAIEFKYVCTGDIDFSYIYRYSGNMIPFFIDVENNIFYNQYYRYYQWDNDQSDIIRDCAVLKNKKIPMKYPSIILGEDNGIKVSYFPWVEEGNNNSIPNFYRDWNRDIFWGRHNMLWNLPPVVVFSKEISKNISPEEVSDKIWSGFKSALRNMYSSLDCPLADIINDHEEEMKWFINKNYDVSQTFEYKSLTDINDIIYTVTYKLR